MPELRKDPVTREWVIIATERSKRPEDFRREPEEQREEFCPFCPGNESCTPPEIVAFRPAGQPRDVPGWWVRVVANMYPALSIEGPLGKSGRGMYDKMNGIGAHEVIIETPNHDETLATMTTKQIEDVVWAYRQRYQDLRRDPRMKYVLIFKNHGRRAGASRSHPHSQLIATPVVPREVRDEIDGVTFYQQFRDRCVYCDMVAQELQEGERVMFENEDFVAFEPFASRYPYETWIVPKQHQNSFAAMQDSEHASFAKALKEVLLRIRICLQDPPYNYMLHTSPCDAENSDVIHWHLEVVPRLTIAAGFEMGTRIYINVTPPEKAAADLRAVETAAVPAQTADRQKGMP